MYVSPWPEVAIFGPLGEQIERDWKYRAALNAARARTKPFLVVGGPYGGVALRQMLRIPSHPGGDMCVDLDPAACAGANYVPGDIRALPFQDKEFGSVLCSHVLEHMRSPGDAALAWEELNRVADEVFVCVPNQWDLVAWLHPDHYLWVWQVDKDTIAVQDRATGAHYQFRAGS